MLTANMNIEILFSVIADTHVLASLFICKENTKHYSEASQHRKMMAFRADKIAILILLCLVIMVSVESGSARDIVAARTSVSHGTAFSTLQFSRCCNNIMKICCGSAGSAAQEDTKSAHELGSFIEN
ncbi:hypothetical protein OIU84_028522 [Salix udensis]|uniref:Uncharacterized protein n=1 Tax=Salix udensis TaxID=889485 RepID=A0AAD6KEB8_9ROSI|nr:hypothetical protein OIU84_028522 [Salix udensis]